MKNLIIYASKYGCTADCARKLADLLNGETEVIDIKNQAKIKISDWERILIGSSVYMGQVNKKIKSFCEDYKEQLFEKELVIFICSGIPENFDDVINANFSDELREHARETVHFGGRLELSKMNFMDKTIAGLMAKQKGEAKPVVEINETAILELAKKLNS